MGDSLYQWRRIPFRIIQNGPYWIPPICEKQQIENDIFFMRNNNMNNKRNKNMNQQKMNVLDHNNDDNKLRRNNGMRGDEDNNILSFIGSRTRLTSRPLSDGDRSLF